MGLMLRGSDLGAFVHRTNRKVSGIGHEQMTAAIDRFAVHARISPFIILRCLRLRMYRSRFITGLFI